MSVRIVREPRVYLVGRQQVDDQEIERFLRDYGLSWQTDTEVGAERLVEAGGRVCYLSFGKGRRSNAEYIGNLISQRHGSVLEHAVWNFPFSSYTGMTSLILPGPNLRLQVFAHVPALYLTDGHQNGHQWPVASLIRICRPGP